jgi:hypothetical protein
MEWKHREENPQHKNNGLIRCQTQLDFEIKMKNNSLALFDAKHNLILKTPLSKNRTFQINMTTAKVMCLSAVETEDKIWIWHARVGHLNFKSL